MEVEQPTEYKKQRLNRMSRKQSRRWCFTEHGESPILFDASEMNYLVYQKETCPTTNKSHWQGYVEMKKKITLGGIKKKVSNNAHWEIAKGSAESNKAYCHKEQEGSSDKAEYGEPMAQGERTDLEAMTKSVLSGEMKVSEILEANPIMYHTYGRTLEKAEVMRMNKRHKTSRTWIVWIWGKTGTGKTYALKKLIEAEGRKYEDAYWHTVNDREWWQTYEQQEDVILDDYRGELPFQYLLRLGDEYPVAVTKRNIGTINFTSKMIWITSSKPPQEIYSKMTDSTDRIEQLLRRIKKVIHLENPYDANNDEQVNVVEQMQRVSADRDCDRIDLTQE